MVARAVRLHQMARVKREALEMFQLEGKHLGDRAGLEARFATALETLWIAYQPIVSWSRRTTFACEALVRNEEPTLRSPPDLFEAAERLGRVQELGRTVRERVAQTLDAHPIRGCCSSTCTPWSWTTTRCSTRRRRCRGTPSEWSWR